MDEELFRDEHQRESQLRDQRESQLRESQLPLPGVEDPAQRRAANDDRQSVGQILQALQQRPRAPPT